MDLLTPTMQALAKAADGNYLLSAAAEEESCWWRRHAEMEHEGC